MGVLFRIILCALVLGVAWLLVSRATGGSLDSSKPATSGTPKQQRANQNAAERILNSQNRTKNQKGAAQNTSNSNELQQRWKVLSATFESKVDKVTRRAKLWRDARDTFEGDGESWQRMAYTEPTANDVACLESIVMP